MTRLTLDQERGIASYIEQATILHKTMDWPTQSSGMWYQPDRVFWDNGFKGDNYTIRSDNYGRIFVRRDFDPTYIHRLVPYDVDDETMLRTMEADLDDVLRWVRSEPCASEIDEVRSEYDTRNLSRSSRLQLDWNLALGYQTCYNGDWDAVIGYGTFESIHSVVNSACNMGIGCKDIAYHYRRWKDVGIVPGDAMSHVDQLYNASLVSNEYHRRVWRYYLGHQFAPFTLINGLSVTDRTRTPFVKASIESVLAVEDPDFVDGRPASELRFQAMFQSLLRTIYVPKDYPVGIN
jgi:hypothetical protein